MSKDRAKVYNISLSCPFADTLAQGLLSKTARTPLALADYLILLPTRRACRALQESFLRLNGGRALLLPQMQPLGDIEEDALVLSAGFERLGDLNPLAFQPAIGTLQRQLLLTRLVTRMKQAGAYRTPDQAVRLAGELARFLDQVQTEQLSLDNLEELVLAEYAEHWQKTLAFLDIIRQFWPEILAERGEVDPGFRRNQMLMAQAQSWDASPPQRPVVAAGSTASLPATAALLRVIARMPGGCVILPGLDTWLSEKDWQIVLRDESHPQYGMAHFLAQLSIGRENVIDWPVTAGLNIQKNDARERLLSETFRPADTTEAWRHLPMISAKALSGVRRIDCPSGASEAGVIALLMREMLEQADKTAALITPDRTLARRVSLEMRRWGITLDDSAGIPLATTPPGGFMRLVADAVAVDLAPVPLLALLKHPLTRLGLATGLYKKQLRDLELLILRGPRPAGGIDGLRSALSVLPDAKTVDAHKFIDRIQTALSPLLRLFEMPDCCLPDMLTAHIQAAEKLAETPDQTGADRLWRGEAGETLAGFLMELQETDTPLDIFSPRQYPALLDSLMAGRVVRPKFGTHPRLFIWGPLEARLQRADLIILGGLNEGSWPVEAKADPWMSRPMRRAFGLPLPERRIGLGAHDFCQALGADKIFLTRAEKIEGEPTVPSRWLSRLDVVLKKAGFGGKIFSTYPYARWWEQLGHAKSNLLARPAPCPPTAARPRCLSVTRIETWRRDPYGIYARYILALKALEPLEADPGAAERGIYIHDALDKFIAALPQGELPQDAARRLARCGQEAFAPALGLPAVRAFWWPRFQRIASWFLAEENKRRQQGMQRAYTEITGCHTFSAPGGDFILTAKADRIDLLADNRFAIIDYKTGTPPRKKDIDSGYAPQLSLEAALVMAGGFKALKPGAVGELAYWQLSGNDPAGTIKTYSDEIAALAEQAMQGVSDLIVEYDNPAMPYHAVPVADYAPRFNDYEHLSRVREWQRNAGKTSE